MKCILAITAFVCLSYMETGAQTISVDSFALGETSLGSYTQYRVHVFNDRGYPIRFVGTTCTGLGSIEATWSGFDSTALKPARGVNLYLLIVPRTMSEISLRCTMQFADTSNNLLPLVEYHVTGLVTSAAILTTNLAVIDFGSVELGDTATSGIIIRNTGDGDAHLYQWGNYSMPFRVDRRHWVVKPSDSITIPVSFIPSELIDYAEDASFGYLARDIEPPL